MVQDIMSTQMYQEKIWPDEMLACHVVLYKPYSYIYNRKMPKPFAVIMVGVRILL